MRICGHNFYMRPSHRKRHEVRRDVAKKRRAQNGVSKPWKLEAFRVQRGSDERFLKNGLHALNHAHGKFTMTLHAAKIVDGDASHEEWPP